MAGRIEEDIYFTGAVRFAEALLNDGAIGDDEIEADAGIAHTKLEHEHRVHYSQPNTTATAVTIAVFRCAGPTGEVLSVHAGSIAPAVGAATVTVDVKKNGVTILTGVITLDNGNAAYVAEAGTISSGTLAVGDVITIVTTATAGGGTIPTGLFVSLNIREDTE